MDPLHPGTVLAACLDQSLARDDAIRTAAQQIDVPSNVLADIIAGKAEDDTPAMFEHPGNCLKSCKTAFKEFLKAFEKDKGKKGESCKAS